VRRRTTQLANDGDELEDMFGKYFIAGDGEFGAGRFTIDSLGEQAPGNGLGNDGVGADRRGKVAGEPATLGVRLRTAAFTRACFIKGSALDQRRMFETGKLLSFCRENVFDTL